MADGMSSEFSQLLAERKLLRMVPKRNTIPKEVEGALLDLKDAEDPPQRRKFKWATIQACCSMFHSARALRAPKAALMSVLTDTTKRKKRTAKTIPAIADSTYNPRIFLVLN